MNCKDYIQEVRHIAVEPNHNQQCIKPASSSSNELALSYVREEPAPPRYFCFN